MTYECFGLTLPNGDLGRSFIKEDGVTFEFHPILHYLKLPEVRTFQHRSVTRERNKSQRVIQYT
jgi:hypothetical protein